MSRRTAKSRLGDYRRGGPALAARSGPTLHFAVLP